MASLSESCCIGQIVQTIAAKVFRVWVILCDLGKVCDMSGMPVFNVPTKSESYRNITAAFNQIANLAVELIQNVEHVHHVVLFYQTAAATFRHRRCKGHSAGKRSPYIFMVSGV